MNSEMSLYLPFVSPELDETYIRNVIENTHQLGKTSRIDIIMKSASQNSVYIHFHFWNQHLPSVRQLRTLLKKYGKQQLLHNPMNGSYWNLMVNTSKGKHFVSGDRRICVETVSSVKEESNIIAKSNSKLKSNSFFADLVNQKIIDLKKEESQFEPNIPLFSKLDYKNMKDISSVLDDEFYMDLFSKDIESFDSCYFEDEE